MLTTKSLNKDFIFGISIFFLSIIGVWYSLSLADGAQIFPLMIIVPSVFLGMAIAYRSQKEKLKRTADGPFFVNIRRFFLLFVYMLLFFLGMDYLGYFTTSIIMLPLLSWLLGYRNLKVVIGATIGFLSFIYVLFIVIFSRPLPQEIWNILLDS